MKLIPRLSSLLGCILANIPLSPAIFCNCLQMFLCSFQSHFWHFLEQYRLCLQFGQTFNYNFVNDIWYNHSFYIFSNCLKNCKNWKMFLCESLFQQNKFIENTFLVKSIWNDTKPVGQGVLNVLGCILIEIELIFFVVRFILKKISRFARDFVRRASLRSALLTKTEKCFCVFQFLSCHLTAPCIDSIHQNARKSTALAI